MRDSRLGIIDNTMEGTSTMDAAFALNDTVTDSAPVEDRMDSRPHRVERDSVPRAYRDVPRPNLIEVQRNTERNRGVTVLKTDGPFLNTVPTGLAFHQELRLPLVLPKFCTYESRYRTFQDRWPKFLPGPKTEDMARAGFVYHGTSDHVQCFCCGICLKDWEWTDDAFGQHRRWSKNCAFCQLVV